MTQTAMKPLDKLRHEQALLKAEVQHREQQLNKKLKYLEDHFTSMAVYSLLPVSADQKEKMSGIFSKINETISNIIPIKISEEKKEKYGNVLKMAEMVAAGVAYKYLTKLWK